ncbi:bile acid:sodium symporter [Planomonospora parontospora]|uniref:bile acid:sodium symporter n=1 Tax=Planomonospora parontospora TaxID=58119 RepID=UPI00167055C5|nr:bile acid:sodium symporter [Planomonospora parontospora]GGL43176.1 arsenic resistance protein [Planomonospora parontospora subsp. antibiotica]GII18512.1 arsenic resistance protein [Planomonospora parontospora subsp. antibiotica]
MPRAVAWWDEHQIALYLTAIAAGALTGLLAPQAAPVLERAINPVLALLLFATFLAVPTAEVGRAFRDVRFLATVLTANFAVVPAIVYGLSRFVADERALMLGLLLVLLTPCIDYVIVFTGLAGGARARLLAAAPLLMLVQMLLLPVYLLAFAGPDVLAVVEMAPFLEAFGVLIAAPLATAALVQALARRHRAGRAAEEAMAASMVPLMMATLAVVVGSQIASVGAQVTALARVIPLYAAFVVLAVAVGRLAARTARLDVAATRAVMFSAATRNSLVVLPLALALPPALGIAPLAVVTQTLVELVAMVVLVRLVPTLVPEPLPADATPMAGR